MRNLSSNRHGSHFAPPSFWSNNERGQWLCLQLVWEVQGRCFGARVFLVGMIFRRTGNTQKHLITLITTKLTNFRNVSSHNGMEDDVSDIFRFGCLIPFIFEWGSLSQGRVDWEARETCLSRMHSFWIAPLFHCLRVPLRFCSSVHVPSDFPWLVIVRGWNPSRRFFFGQAASIPLIWPLFSFPFFPHFPSVAGVYFRNTSILGNFGHKPSPVEKGEQGVLVVIIFLGITNSTPLVIFLQCIILAFKATDVLAIILSSHKTFFSTKSQLTWHTNAIQYSTTTWLYYAVSLSLLLSWWSLFSSSSSSWVVDRSMSVKKKFVSFALFILILVDFDMRLKSSFRIFIDVLFFFSLSLYIPRTLHSLSRKQVYLF